MVEDSQLNKAARAIFEACFTLAPITFEEAQRRKTLHYKRAMVAAERAGELLLMPAQERGSE